MTKNWLKMEGSVCSPTGPSCGQINWLPPRIILYVPKNYGIAMEHIDDKLWEQNALYKSPNHRANFEARTAII